MVTGISIVREETRPDLSSPALLLVWMKDLIAIAVPLECLVIALE